MQWQMVSFFKFFGFWSFSRCRGRFASSFAAQLTHTVDGLRDHARSCATLHPIRDARLSRRRNLKDRNNRENAEKSLTF